MSEQEQLPVCALCGEIPMGGGTAVVCMTLGCGIGAAVLDETEWRRLMARPRLAPEHVEELRRVVSFFDSAKTFDGSTQAHAIRAAIAVLGEE